jgi:two-component system, OmpR family, response regulator ResD
MPELLVVDDDPAIVELLKMYLEKSEFVVREATTGPDCLDEVDRRRPDLVLLDIMLPGLDGYEVCQVLRHRHGVPIIFVSARDDELDPIIGLEFGADDYITKPFNPREVVARVKAVLRRSAQGPVEPSTAVRHSGFEIDPATRETRVNGHAVALTPREFDIVLLLARRPRIVFSRQQILQEVWGYGSDYSDYRTVDTHLKRARQKLVEAGMDTCTIETVWGTGYRFVVGAGD